MHRVRDTLDASPISQAELARRIGRSQQQVSDWMAGRAGPPPPDVVFAMEDALDCPDLLASALGYVRHKSTDAIDCIRRDESLPETARRTLADLVELYRRQP
jgi:transcriptional regulator with XRE-family HTH domain